MDTYKPWWVGEGVGLLRQFNVGTDWTGRACGSVRAITTLESLRCLINIFTINLILMYVNCYQEKSYIFVACRLKINLGRDIHYAFILGLLVCKAVQGDMELLLCSCLDPELPGTQSAGEGRMQGQARSV